MNVLAHFTTHFEQAQSEIILETMEEIRYLVFENIKACRENEESMLQQMVLKESEKAERAGREQDFQIVSDCLTRLTQIKRVLLTNREIKQALKRTTPGTNYSMLIKRLCYAVHQKVVCNEGNKRIIQQIETILQDVLALQCTDPNYPKRIMVAIQNLDSL